MDEQRNGERYVTHQRLADVMDAHRRDEDGARDAMATRLSASIDRKARAEDVQRLATDLGSVTTTVNAHDDQWQRMSGMMALARVAFGSSIISAIASVVAIVAALVALR